LGGSKTTLLNIFQKVGQKSAEPPKTFLREEGNWEFGIYWDKNANFL